MFTFFLLTAVFVFGVFASFGAQDVAEKASTWYDKEEVDRKTWQSLVGNHWDSSNRVRYAYRDATRKHCVTVENTRLGLTEVFCDKDRLVVIRKIREQFDEWAKM